MSAQSSPDIVDIRKQVARIISPKAKFEDFVGIHWSMFDLDRRRVAYEKADAVIALLSHAQSAPMRADIAQIISEGWRNGKSAAEVAEAVLQELDAPAQVEREPGVTIHQEDAEWAKKSDTQPQASPDCLYPDCGCPSAECEPQTPRDRTVEGERDAIIQVIHKHVGVKDLFDGAQMLTGVEDAAEAILTAMRSSEEMVDLLKRAQSYLDHNAAESGADELIRQLVSALPRPHRGGDESEAAGN